MDGEVSQESWLEVIVPARNPGTKLLESVDSLLAQTERGFAVVLSDNSSNQGSEMLYEARARLESGGIPVRVLRPPWELGRVEHWNWAHHMSRAAWLKPLFVGDLLAPGYVSALRHRVSMAAHASIVRCNFEQITEAGVFPSFRPPFPETTLTPAAFLKYYPVLGNWLGAPVNIAYTRSAWISAGGYPTHLPACADLSLHVSLALRSGIELIPASLASFQLHDQRFSKGIAHRRVNGAFELWLILRQVRNYCENAQLPWPKNGVAKGVLLQLRIDYWHPMKRALNEFLNS